MIKGLLWFLGKLERLFEDSLGIMHLVHTQEFPKNYQFLNDDPLIGNNF